MPGHRIYKEWRQNNSWIYTRSWRQDVHCVSPAPGPSPGIAGLQPGPGSHAGAWRSQGKPWRTGRGFMQHASRQMPVLFWHCPLAVERALLALQPSDPLLAAHAVVGPGNEGTVETWCIGTHASYCSTARCSGGGGVPVSMPRALMSSSMSGQWTPCPVPIISKCWRWLGVALDRRHDHASGTLIVRPSASWALTRSSVTSTVRMRGSFLATMVMPCLQNVVPRLQNHRPDPVQFPGGKPMIHT